MTGSVLCLRLYDTRFLSFCLEGKYEKTTEEWRGEPVMRGKPVLQSKGGIEPSNGCLFFDGFLSLLQVPVSDRAIQV